MVRYPTAAVEARLNERFNLVAESWYQDWPLEVADAGRVEEFLKAYETEAWSDDERYALMELLLYSYDEAPDVTAPNRVWPRLSAALLQAFELHRPTMLYWCLFDHSPDDVENPDHLFHLTPLIRDVWDEALGNS